MTNHPYERTYIPPSGHPHRFHNPVVLEVFQLTRGFSFHESSYELCVLVRELKGQWHDLEGLGERGGRGRVGGEMGDRDGEGTGGREGQRRS